MNGADRSARVHLGLSSRAENVPLIRQALSGMADATGLPPVDLNDIGSAVTEACNNASVHAYGDGEGPLEVQFLAQDSTMVATVRDRGVGLVLNGDDPVAFPSDVDGDLTGIGVPSIKTLASSARWSEPSDGGTEVEMTFSTGPLRYDAGGGYAFDDVFSAEPGRRAGAIEAGMAPLSVASGVLPRLLRVMADRAGFSVERHAAVQRIGAAVLATDRSMWAPSGVHARLLADVGSLEIAIGPLSEEDVARLVIAASAIEPGIVVSAERLADQPRRLVLQLGRSADAQRTPLPRSRRTPQGL
jgi:serine/threonine-protein kinase RsbW